MSAHGYSPAPSPTDAWEAPSARRPLSAAVDVPGSKSLTNRELVLAALAHGPSVLQAPLHSDDSARMVDALRALGAQIDEVDEGNAFGPDLVVTPGTPMIGGTVDCGQAGTVMRFVTALAGLVEGDVRITAHESALHRPMSAMIRALRELGVDIDDGGSWSLPFLVRGRGHVRGGEIEIDASASSQFVSGLLLAAPRFDVGLHLVHRGERLPSLPHINMTVESLARRGVHVERPAPGEWIVPPATIRAKDLAIEPDLSNAAPFLAAPLIAGGTVTVGGWPTHSTQPGIQLPEILGEMGADAHRKGSTLTVSAGSRIRGIERDLSAVSELTPTLVGLAVYADAPSTFTGIGHIRGHETDRLSALVENLRAIGVHAEELPDGIRVIPSTPRPALWRAFHDHRLATTGALVGLAVDGMRIDDIGTTAKTIPEFVSLWDGMLSARAEL